MHESNARLQQLARDCFSRRPIFALLALLAAAGFYVSQGTHREVTAAVRDGAAIIDSRAQSARLLQLLADAKTAEYGFLLTGQPGFVTQFEAARQKLPDAQDAVVRHMANQGAGGAAAAREAAGLAGREFAQISRSFELAQRGDVAAATERVAAASSRTEWIALRQTLDRQLDHGATRLQANRTSLDEALWLGPLMMGVLTLATLAGLLMLFMQLRREDLERHDERERLAAEVKHRAERLTELAQYFQSVREDERSSIARELHDELGALLTVCKLEIARARNSAVDDVVILKSLERVTASLNKGIALKRRIIEDLTPSSLTQLGLTVALEILCKDMSTSLAVPVDVSMVSLKLAPEAELAVYRFVQEALTNIGKYASASAISVKLTAALGHAAVEVQDNGVGFDANCSRVGRHGLSGMQFRAESLGGFMSMRSAPGQGATLRIEFPQSRAT